MVALNYQLVFYKQWIRLKLLIKRKGPKPKYMRMIKNLMIFVSRAKLKYSKRYLMIKQQKNKFSLTQLTASILNNNLVLKMIPTLLANCEPWEKLILPKEYKILVQKLSQTKAFSKFIKIMIET